MATELSVERLLAIIREFDEFGGTSPGLVAWELFEPERNVEPVFSRAIADGLLEPAGEDPVNGEPLYRLSEKGWRSRDKR